VRHVILLVTQLRVKKTLLEESCLRFFEKVCRNNFLKNNTLKISALNQTDNKIAGLQKNYEVQNVNLS